MDPMGYIPFLLYDVENHDIYQAKTFFDFFPGMNPIPSS
jgi:hypothetical protein